jgi:hypothetical protein
MDKLYTLLSIEDARKVLVAPDLDVRLLSDKQCKNAVIISLHCCLNGPVGVGKDTTFPIIGEGSIKSLVSEAVTNRIWKKLCWKMADYISHLEGWEDVIEKCSSFNQKGKIWPLSDEVPL